MTNMVDRNERMTAISPPILGFNTKDAPMKLPEGQGVDCYNIEIDEVLGINKRNGFAQFNTSSQLLPKYAAGTIKEITGLIVKGSGTAWTAAVAASDVFYMKGNSSSIYWPIAGVEGPATMTLAYAYTQTVTGSSYIIGPKEVSSLYNYKYATTQKLLAFAGNDGFAATAGATGSFTALSAGLTDYAPVHGVTFQDKFYFCNGYEFKSYDGSSVSSVSGSPDPSNPLYVCVFAIGNANWLCIAGSNTDAKKSQVAFSDVNAPGTWPAANIFYAGDRDGQVITGLASMSAGVAIFKESSIYLYQGIPGAGSLRRVVDEIGCVAPYSIVAYKGYVYFIGKRGGKLGLYVFDGTPNVVCLSESIEPTLNALALGSATKFYGAIYEDKYVLAARSGAKNDVHFICYIERPFNFMNKPYFPWVRGNRGMASLLTQDVSGTTYLFSGSPSNGFVNREDTGTSDNTVDNLSGISAAITSYADSAWLDFGDNSRQKELLRTYIDVTASGDWNLLLYLYRDYETYGYDQYSIPLGSNTLSWSEVVFLVTPWQTAVDKSTEEVVFNYSNIAKHFKFRWTNNNSGEYFTVYPMTLYYKMENR